MSKAFRLNAWNAESSGVRGGAELSWWSVDIEHTRQIQEVTMGSVARVIPRMYTWRWIKTRYYGEGAWGGGGEWAINSLSRTLRSSSDTRMLGIQQYKRKTHGFRTFSCFGPHIWNSLPQDLRHCSTLSSFKAKLKTFLFLQYSNPN